MIDLLGELNPNQLWPIEEALLRLADEKGPNISLDRMRPRARRAGRVGKW